jgi:hypothetical protein
MNKDVTHIRSCFSDTLNQEDWKSKFYGGTLVMYFDDKYIEIEDIFAIVSKGKKVEVTDLKKF